jgi:hypothetical protein
MVTRAFKLVGDRMLSVLLPQAQAKACHTGCCWVSYQCWRRVTTGCVGCNYGGPSCGCHDVCGWC